MTELFWNKLDLLTTEIMTYPLDSTRKKDAHWETPMITMHVKIVAGSKINWRIGKWQSIQNGFRARFNFPQRGGVIDEKHVFIKWPPDICYEFLSTKEIKCHPSSPWWCRLPFYLQRCQYKRDANDKPRVFLSLLFRIKPMEWSA